MSGHCTVLTSHFSIALVQIGHFQTTVVFSKHYIIYNIRSQTTFQRSLLRSLCQPGISNHCHHRPSSHRHVLLHPELAHYQRKDCFLRRRMNPAAGLIHLQLYLPDAQSILADTITTMMQARACPLRANSLSCS